ncbi:uncharacterized protein LOC121865524 [Homarus americanus]|uniref:uncharacterized protein LOC121865524 n=1 Tax=Homarus americanus TaxID=6706 RepID=UPI001C476DD9|nr:uncharacterized protein LOC121865524 [Homarus americanus]
MNSRPGKEQKEKKKKQQQTKKNKEVKKKREKKKTASPRSNDIEMDILSVSPSPSPPHPCRNPVREYEEKMGYKRLKKPYESPRKGVNQIQYPMFPRTKNSTGYKAFVDLTLKVDEGADSEAWSYTSGGNSGGDGPFAFINLAYEDEQQVVFDAPDQSTSEVGECVVGCVDRRSYPSINIQTYDGFDVEDSTTATMKTEVDANTEDAVDFLDVVDGSVQKSQLKRKHTLKSEERDGQKRTCVRGKEEDDDDEEETNMFPYGEFRGSKARRLTPNYGVTRTCGHAGQDISWTEALSSFR